MSRDAATGALPAWISLLIGELLEASADSVELLTAQRRELRCAAHLDYLKALQRKGNELMAHADLEALP